MKTIEKLDQALALGRLSTAPANSVDGTIYYDTTVNRFRKKVNGSWVEDVLPSDLALKVNQTELSSLQTQVNTIETNYVDRITAENVYNKTLSNSSIINPDRLDIKSDIYSNLITYALTASNGQLVFAYDTKQMFQVVDGTLKSVGGAGGSLMNLLVNGSFEEADLSEYVVAAGTKDRTDVTILPTPNNKYAGVFTLNTGGTVTITKTLNIQYTDVSGKLNYWIKSTDRIKVEVLVNSTVVSTQVVEGTNKWVNLDASFLLSEGSVVVRFTNITGADGLIFRLDEVYLGANNSEAIVDDLVIQISRMTNHENIPDLEVDWNNCSNYKEIATNSTFTFSNLPTSKSHQTLLVVKNTGVTDINLTLPIGLVKRADFSLVVRTGKINIYTFIYVNNKVYVAVVTDMVE